MVVKKIFIALFAVGFVSTFALNNPFAHASLEKQIDNSMVAITKQINKEISLKTELSYSSNPYDYVKENQDFKDIVNLGNAAIPLLHKKLSASPNDGLQEYLLAIAIEQISKTDLKKEESTQWQDAKEFSSQWKKYLQAIPAKVDEISANMQLPTEVKLQQIQELGTPAIPFILDKIEQGNEELVPAVIELAKSNNNKSMLQDKNISNKKEWASEQKPKFKDLKEYVLEQQN